MSKILTVPLILVATDQAHKTKNLLKALDAVGLKISIESDTFSIQKV